MQRNTKYEKMIINEIKTLPESKMPMILQFVRFVGCKEYIEQIETNKINKTSVLKHDSIAGVLKKYAKPELISKEKSIAWRKAAKAK